MNDGDVSTPNWVEPQLIPGGAIAVQLECLCDPQDLSAVLVVTARDVHRGKLVGLWSKPPVPFERLDQHLRDAISEFLVQVAEASHPFPDRS